MKVNDIFLSVNGEQSMYGIGSVAIFLRLWGCNLDCKGCDTPQCLPASKDGFKIPYVSMTVEEVFDRMIETTEHNEIHVATITGGEPLLYAPEVSKLCTKLINHGLDIIIETNGTLPILPVLDDNPEFVVFVVDYKTVASGVKTHFHEENLPILRPVDTLKFVLYDKTDYMDMYGVVKRLGPGKQPHVTVGLHSDSAMTYADLIQTMKEDRILGEFVDSINFQAHKLLNLK